MNFVFLTDPLSTVVMDTDTTFILMLESHRRGYNVFFLPEGGIALKDGKTYFHVKRVTPQLSMEKPFIEHEKIILPEDKVDALFIRTDPPFDKEYLIQTWLLDNLAKKIPVINNPNGVRSANEKIFTAQFTGIIPKTLISRHREDLLGFLAKEKNIIAKPTDGHGGKFVFHIKLGDRNTNAILETLTNFWKNEIILQKYVSEAVKGDKRILLLNGEPLGAILRLHSKNDHRNNIYAGGRPLATTITANDKKIIKAIKPKLRELGLHFVGIDILGKYLIEINVTSPTCLQEMNRAYNVQLEKKVINFVEKMR